jgi:exopolysaccharide biosynthesis protein
MLRRVLIVAVACTAVAAPAASAQIRGQTLVPGVVYSRQVEVTSHGPVALNVVSAPRPTGLYSIRAALSQGAVPGRARLTDMEKEVSATATVVGINADYFKSRWGTPASLVVRGGVLAADANGRSAAGFDADGALHVDRVSLSATWKGMDQYRTMGFNEPPGKPNTTLYTPAWGAKTPAEPDATEVVLAPFPPALPNRILSAPVVQVVQGGGQPIPVDGAVLVARGADAKTLTAQAPVGGTVSVRLVLTPAWSDVVEAVGGGPGLVRDGRPVFRANEPFPARQLFTRTARSAIAQTSDGHILLAAVDGGRRGYSTGMTNFELALALARLGAVKACALGTGPATTLAFDGKLLNRPSGRGETAIADALLIEYGGVYVPQLPASVATGKTVTLAYKVVRPSTVTATLTGPDGTTVTIDSAAHAAGTYSSDWTAASPGRWTFTVTAVDNLHRSTSAERTFTVST